MTAHAGGTASETLNLSNFFQLIVVAVAICGAAALDARADSAEEIGATPEPAIAMHGAPGLPADFTHAPFVNPDAAKGGRLRVGQSGAFNTLNYFAPRGRAPFAIRSMVFESLMARNWDEPFSLYGLLAETIATPPDRSFVAFTLRPEARFSNGAPVTVDDVIWSMETLRDQGKPNHRRFYSQISKVERIGARTVKFHFAEPNREAPLLMGVMPILSKSDWEGRDFAEATFRRLVGSGPYTIADVEPGRRLRFERNPEYWGADLPINRGRHNFDVVEHVYFRSAETMWEAFTAGDLDIFREFDPQRWSAGYTFPAAREGRVTQTEVAKRWPSSLHGFVFNTRNPVFADRRVRAALAAAFDYQWVNDTFYAGRMTPIASYFGGSELAHAGAAEGAERALLAPFAAQLPEGALDAPWTPAAGAGDGRNRKALRRAGRMLAEAGWTVAGDGVLRDTAGTPLAFEILVDKTEDERIARVFADGLKPLGVQAAVRLVDKVQRAERMIDFDFDMIVYRWYVSPSPGQEQENFFGSGSRDAPGSRNYAGVADPALDGLIRKMLEARDREAFVAAAKAYDRVLTGGVYVVPWGWRSSDWIAHDAALRKPLRDMRVGFSPDVWWRAAP